MKDDAEERKKNDSIVNKESLGLISNRSYTFRIRLIQDFKLTEKCGADGKRVFAKEFCDEARVQDIMVNNQNSSISFDSSELNRTRRLIMEKEIDKVDKHKRRSSRLKNRHFTMTPTHLWAHWIVESRFYSITSILAIVLNAIVVGIQLDHGLVLMFTDVKASVLLYVLDTTVCLILVTQLTLKWIDHFREFWRSVWNVIDFVITMVAVIPNLICGYHPRLTKILYIQRFNHGSAAKVMFLLRALVCFKLINRVPKVRMLILAITKASRSLFMVFLLFIIMAFITAVFGVTFFDSVDLMLILLFKLFTLDGWVKLYKDMKVIVDGYAAGIFVLAWIIAGSYIIGNMFVGILVSNFIEIRQELMAEVDKEQDNDIRRQADEITQVQLRLKPERNKRSVTKKEHQSKDAHTRSNSGGGETTPDLSGKTTRTPDIHSQYLQFLPTGDPIGLPPSPNSPVVKSHTADSSVLNTQPNIGAIPGEVIPTIRSVSENNLSLITRNKNASNKRVYPQQDSSSRSESSDFETDTENIRQTITLNLAEIHPLRDNVEPNDYGKTTPRKSVRINIDKQAKEVLPSSSDIHQQIRTNIRRFSSVGLGRIESQLLDMTSTRRSLATSRRDTLQSRTQLFEHAPPPSAHRESLFAQQCQGISSDYDNVYLWQKTIKHLCRRLKKVDTVTTWQRDVYFYYLVLMEHLQENIMEREKLLTKASQALLALLDKESVADDSSSNESSSTPASGSPPPESRRKSMRQYLMPAVVLNRWKLLTRAHRRSSLP